MNANQIKLIAKAVEIAGFEIDESKPLFEVFEKAYETMTYYARDNQDEFEVVFGEFSNHYKHVYAQSADGTEYECDGQIIDGNETGGEIVGDFIDKEGNFVIVAFPRDK